MGDPSALYATLGAVAVWAASATAVLCSRRRPLMKVIAVIPVVTALACMTVLCRLPHMEHRLLIDIGMPGAPIVAAGISWAMLRKRTSRRLR
jgi:hypothetical protein